MVLKSLFSGQQWKNIENRPVGIGRGEKRVRCMESNMGAYITICKIGSQGEFTACLRKPKQELCTNLEGWVGEGSGREVQNRGHICIPMAALC